MIDRRGFLRAGLFGAAGLALAACKGKQPLPADLPPSLRGIVAEQLAAATPGLQVFPGALELLAGETERFPFGLAGSDGLAAVPDRARLWVAREGASTGPVTARYERYGKVVLESDPDGFHVAAAAWPATAGVTDILVEATLAGHRTYGWATVQTRSAPTVPAVGRPAVLVATPTVGNPRGVANLCTREPPCSLHGATLRQTAAKHRPIVFTIASPLLCTSRTCGPVLEEVLSLPPASYDAVHAEPYKGDAAAILSPTARAWRIESEPWTFVIDGSGVVRARFEGPVVAGELLAALQPLL